MAPRMPDWVVANVRDIKRRASGVIAAIDSAIVNFAFIPIYPVWAIVIITLDVLVIWALAAHGRDLTTP